MVKKASEAIETASYVRGVLEIKTRLAEEVVGVCRDYCAETWAEALNRVRVPVDFELRRIKNVFFLKDIQEIPTTLPPSVVDPLPPPEVLPTIQAPPLDAEVSTGVGKGKEVQPPVKTKDSEDTFRIKDMVFKAKDVERKSKAGDSQSKAVDPKNDSHSAKA